VTKWSFSVYLEREHPILFVNLILKGCLQVFWKIKPTVRLTQAEVRSGDKNPELLSPDHNTVLLLIKDKESKNS